MHYPLQIYTGGAGEGGEFSELLPQMPTLLNLKYLKIDRASSWASDTTGTNQLAPLSFVTEVYFNI